MHLVICLQTNLLKIQRIRTPNHGCYNGKCYNKVNKVWHEQDEITMWVTACCFVVCMSLASDLTDCYCEFSFSPHLAKSEVIVQQNCCASFCIIGIMCICLYFYNLCGEKNNSFTKMPLPTFFFLEWMNWLNVLLFLWTMMINMKMLSSHVWASWWQLWQDKRGNLLMVVLTHLFLLFSVVPLFIL